MKKQEIDTVKAQRIILLLIAFLYLIFALFYYYLSEIDDPMPFTHRIFAAFIFLFLFFISYRSNWVKAELEKITCITVYLSIGHILFLNYLTNYQYQLSISLIIVIALANLFFKVEKLVLYINISLVVILAFTLLILENLELFGIVYFLSYISVAVLSYFVSYLRVRKNERFETFIDNMPAGFAYHKIICNNKGNPVDYIFLQVNKNFEEMTGLKNDKIIGKKASEVLEGLSKDTWIDIFGNVALRQESSSFEQYSTPLKRWYKVNVYSQQQGYFTTMFYDITERKKKEKELENNREKLNNILNNIDDVIWSLSWPDLEVEFISSAVEKVYGYTAEEFKENPDLWQEISYPEDLEINKKALKELKEKGQAIKENRILTKKGQIKWIQDKSKMIYNKNRQPVRVEGVARDISKSKQFEEKLKESKKKYEKLAEESPVGIITCDRAGNIDYVNEHLLHHLGFPGKEQTKKINLLNFDLLQKTQFPEKLEQCLESGETKAFEMEYRSLWDKHIWARVYISPLKEKKHITGAQILLDDITNRKQTEQILQEYKNRLSQAQNIARAGTWEYDIENKSLYWSKECSALFGLQEGEFKGTFDDFLQRVHPDDMDYVIKKNKAITEDKKSIDLEYEHRIVCKNGTVRWVREKAGVINSQKEKKIVGFVMDISSKKRYEKIITELHRVANEFQKFTNEEEVCHKIIEVASQILKFDLCHISFLKDKQFVPVAATENMEAKILPLDYGILAKSFKNNENYLTLDVEKDLDAKPTDKTYKSGITVVMKGIGVFQAISTEKYAFTQDDLKLAEILVSQSTAALQRIYSQAAIKDKNMLLRAAFESIQDGITVLNPDFTIRYANSKMKEWYSGKEPLIGKKCYQVYQNASTQCRNCPAKSSLKSGEVEKIEKEIINNDVFLDIKYLEIYSYPMIDKHGEIKGFVEFFRDVTESKKSKNQLQEAKDNLDKEIRKAKEIHERSLPDYKPEIKDIQFYTHYQPAAELGGDFYNFIELDNLILFYILDITGHSLDAAMLSDFVKTTVNTYVELLPDNIEPDPKKILEFIVKQYAKENYPEDFFITILLGTIDLYTYKLIYSCAGIHIPPLKFENELIELPAGNLPISNIVAKELLTYENIEISLSPGTLLFFSTDGLIENSTGKKIYGDRYKKIICNKNYLPPGAIATGINKDFINFHDGKIDDDVTYIIIKLKTKKNFSGLEFEIASNFQSIREAKEKLKKFIIEEIVPLDIDSIIIAFHEMLINAMEHGNKFDENKKIEIKVELANKYISISVKDQGRGFNWLSLKERKSSSIVDMKDEVASRGRGLGYILSDIASDFLYYNYKGNQVTFIKEY